MQTQNAAVAAIQFALETDDPIASASLGVQAGV